MHFCVRAVGWRELHTAPRNRHAGQSQAREVVNVLKDCLSVFSFCFPWKSIFCNSLEVC